MTCVERTAHQISPEALKSLVHLRLKLEKAQGWGVFSAFAGAFVGVYALSGHLRSELLLGLYAAVTASLAAGSAPVIERAGYHYFLRRAHREGLSDVAARALYHRAASAGPWLDVLRSLGREPLEGDLVRFVTDEPAST